MPPRVCRLNQGVPTMLTVRDLRTAYLSAEGFIGQLAQELGETDWSSERLLVTSGTPKPAAWAQNVWFDPIVIEIASITDAARKLRAIQLNWTVYAPRQHRRAMLIQAQLPKVS